jgi:hypothetical protein
MEIKVTVEMTPGFKKLSQGSTLLGIGMLRAGMINLAEEVEARSKKAAPVKTGNLLREIVSWVSGGGTKATVTSQAPYSLWVHEGTGLFGPFKRRIVPTTKKALFWPGASHPVRSTAGMRGNPFFTRALGQINPQGVFEQGVENFLKKEGLI